MADPTRSRNPPLFAPDRICARAVALPACGWHGVDATGRDRTRKNATKTGARKRGGLCNNQAMELSLSGTGNSSELVRAQGCAMFDALLAGTASIRLAEARVVPGAGDCVDTFVKGQRR